MKLAILIFGLLSLLAVCVMLFEGALAPAMWQLLGSIWMLVWLKKGGLE